MATSKLEQQYRQLKAQTKVRVTAQRPRQRRELLAMMEALSRATAASDDQGLHSQVEQMLVDFRRSVDSNN